VPAELRLHRRVDHLTLLQLDHRVRERLDISVRTRPVQIAAVGGRAGVLGALGQVLELGAALELLDDLLGLVFLLQEDVTGAVLPVAHLLPLRLIGGRHFGIRDRALFQFVAHQRLDQRVLALHVELELHFRLLGQAPTTGLLQEYLAANQLLLDHLAQLRRVLLALLLELGDPRILARLGDRSIVDHGQVLREHGGRRYGERKQGKAPQELEIHVGLSGRQGRSVGAAGGLSGRLQRHGERMNFALHQIVQGIIHKAMACQLGQALETRAHQVYPVMPAAALGAFVAGVQRTVVVQPQQLRLQGGAQPRLDAGQPLARRAVRHPAPPSHGATPRRQRPA